MNQSNAWLMIRRRAKAAGIDAPIGNYTFRATGIAAYLANGGALEHAQEMAAHESPRTTSYMTARANGSPRTRWRGSDCKQQIDLAQARSGSSATLTSRQSGLWPLSLSLRTGD